jgi:hypothetical protein
VLLGLFRSAGGAISRVVEVQEGFAGRVLVVLEGFVVLIAEDLISIVVAILLFFQGGHTAVVFTVEMVMFVGIGCLILDGDIGCLSV